MKQRKRLTAWLMALVMVFSVVMIPGGVAKADSEKPANVEQYVGIVLRGATGVSITDNTATITYTGGSVSVEGTDLYHYQNDNWDFGDNNIGTMHYLYTKSTALTFNATPSEGYTAYYDLRDDSGQHEMGNNTFSLNELTVNTEKEVEISFTDSNNGGGGAPAEDGKLQFDCPDYPIVGGKILYKFADASEFTDITKVDNYNDIDVSAQTSVIIKIEANEGYKLDTERDIYVNTNSGSNYKLTDEDKAALISENGLSINLEEYAVEDNGTKSVAKTSYQIEIRFQIAPSIAIKNAKGTTYILKDDEPVTTDYVLKEDVLDEETGETVKKTVFTGNNRTISGIGLQKDNNNNYMLVLDGFNDAGAELIVKGSAATITSAGTNSFKSLVLGDGINLEIRPGISLPDSDSSTANYNDDAQTPVTTIELNLGVYTDNGTADRVGFRDDVKVVIGKTNDPVDAGFKDINRLELYNYEFHKRGNYENNEIYAATAFANVGVVECYYSCLKVQATNLFSGSVEGASVFTNSSDTEDGYSQATSYGIFELFQQARFTYNADISIQENAKIIDRYYANYPDNTKPFEGKTKNAGIIAFNQKNENNELYVQEYDLTDKTKAGSAEKDVVHQYEIEQKDATRIITSTDPIIYSVMYNVVDDGDGRKELEYKDDLGNDKTSILENGNCGQVEMKGFGKGYYIQEGSHGKFEAWIAADQEVTVVIMPDVGYQYVANTLNINGSVITGVKPNENNEAVGQYSFTMFESAGHISAGFKKTDDVAIVDTSNTNISDASVLVDDGVIKNGNAKLEIGAANVTSQIEESVLPLVSNYGGETKYEYMDVTLSESVVKNYDTEKTAKEQDSWDKTLTDLGSNEATITVTLGSELRGFNGYQVIRVHEGVGQDIVDVATTSDGKITFKTDKFSTYVIVAKKFGDLPPAQEGLDYSTPSSGTVKLEGTTVTIENAVISGELCLCGKEYGKTPMTLIVKGENKVEYLIFDTAVNVVCEEGASLTFNAENSDLEAKNEFYGTKGSYTLGANTVLEGNVFRYKAAASGGGEQQPTQPAQPAVNPPAAEQPATTEAPKTEVPKAAEVGATITDTSTGGGTATATYTVTEKSEGAGDAGEVAYTGESADSTATAVTIPATVTGADGTVYEVTKVADNALKGNKTVKEVTVGDNIEEIGASAFQNATNLTTVKLGKKVTKIDKNSFAGCTKLKKVTSSGSAVTSIGESAFKGDKALTSVDFSKSKVKTIGKNAFNGDKKLNTIKLNGNAITKVGKGAFKNIKKKATITIYAKDKKTYNKVVKLIKKSGTSSVKYKYKKKK